MNSEMNKKMAKVIARAWSDSGFKAKLMENPEETLQAEGIELPAEMKITAVENTEEQYYLVIPPKPDELTDEELDQASGGGLGPAVLTWLTHS